LNSITSEGILSFEEQDDKKKRNCNPKKVKDKKYLKALK
jgi:hypothetical protein